MKRAPGKAEKLIHQFEMAAVDHANLDAILWFSPEATAAHQRSVKTAYTRTRNRLLKALENDQ